MMRRSLIGCAIAAAMLVSSCAEPPETEPLARGAQLYRQLDCGRCHSIDGAGGRLGPDLSRIGTVAAERRPEMSADEYVRESVRTPGAYVVPGYHDVMARGLTRGLSDADLDALVLFLLSHH